MYFSRSHFFCRRLPAETSLIAFHLNRGLGPATKFVMSGSRSLSLDEQRQLVRRCRRMKPRDQALICAQLFLGFRIPKSFPSRSATFSLKGKSHAASACRPAT